MALENQTESTTQRKQKLKSIRVPEKENIII